MSHDHGDGDEDPTTEDKWLAFGITVFAGFAAFIGVFVVFCIKRADIQRVIPIVLCFSAGIILHLTAIILYPHSVEEFDHVLHEYEHDGHLEHDEVEALSHLCAMLCVIGGVVGMALFEKFGPNHGHADFDEMHELDSFDQGTAKQDTGNEAKKSLLGGMDKHEIQHVSYSLAASLVLHHLPEGIVTFCSLVYDLDFGVLVALALALHDIPSGISIGSTVYCATGSMVKPFVLCIIAALAYPAGAVIGWIIVDSDGDDELVAALMFGFVAGMMLYIVLIEVIPVAMGMLDKADNGKTRKQSYVAIFCGLLLMEVSQIAMALTGSHSH